VGTTTETLFKQDDRIADKFALLESVVVYHGDCLDLLNQYRMNRSNLLLLLPLIILEKNTKKNSILIYIFSSKPKSLPNVYVLYRQG